MVNPYIAMQNLKKQWLLALAVAWMPPSYALEGQPTPAPDSRYIATQWCENVLAQFNRDKLQGKIDTAQLVDIVRSLNQHHQLPAYFITKREARKLGWHPGLPFNRIVALRGKSIGGDRFGNYERRLPSGDWKEADLDYQGGRRNAKRIVFSQEGVQYVTVDHYQQFHKVPACQ